jgi:hypothetical protein
MVGSGANTIIEVIRQTLIELSRRLNQKGYNMPRKLLLQFDNCGENKNKYFFAFVASLLEQDLFDEIDMNFLIVGHTHTTVDQYFGVLSKGICRHIYIYIRIHIITNN